MRLSPDPARAALQANAIEAKVVWMQNARVHRNWFGINFTNSASHQNMIECIRHARLCSRAAWQLNRSPN